MSQHIPQLQAPLTDDTLALASGLADQFQDWSFETHAGGDYPHREMNALHEAGLFGVTLPDAPLAGGARNTSGLLQLLKHVGRGNLSVGRIYEGHVNALELIRLYGISRQQAGYFAEARAGHVFGVWNTEMHDGIHLDERADGGLSVRGAKSFCSGSVHVTRPIITGVRHGADGAEKGWQMVIPRLDEHELPVDTSFWTPLGMQNSVSHKIDFTGLTIPPEDVLGKPDDYETQPHFSGGAIRFAAVHLGGAEAVLEATTAFLRKLRRTENCYQRTRVGQMAILVESGNQWLDRAGHVNDTCNDAEAVITFANMTRTAIADICIQCLQLAERCVGSRGLMHPGRLARLHTDLSMYLRQPAPDATLEQVGQYYLNHEQHPHRRRPGNGLDHAGRP